MALKEGYKQVSCQLLDHKEKTVLAEANFLCDNTTAVSLPQAPFGGIHYYHVDIGMLKNFIHEIIDYFSSRLFKKIIIKNPADVYNPSHNAIVTNCLINSGFVISNYDINHHIAVDQTEFRTKLHQMEARKLRRSAKLDLVFREITDEAIADVYSFIMECRIEKKVKMNITFDQLNKAVKELPDHYKFFVVDFNGDIIAATVAVLVDHNMLYNYLPASSIAYNKLSPMVFLLSGVYNYCQSKSIKTLDLGISSINNQPQESLITFKERVGGLATLKLSFELDLV